MSKKLTQFHSIVTAWEGRTDRHGEAKTDEINLNWRTGDGGFVHGEGAERVEEEVTHQFKGF